MIHIQTGIENMIAPQNKGDAGIDIIASKNPAISGEIWHGAWYKNISYIEYDTDIRMSQLKPYSKYCLLFPRSSISKYNLSLANSVGVIDSGYNNSIKVRFNYLFQPEDMRGMDNEPNGITVLVGCVNPSKIYKKGDKIAQLIFFDHQDLDRLSFYKSIKNTSNKDRDQGGFGSTGK